MSLLHKQTHVSMLAVAVIGLSLALAPGAFANSAIDQYVEFEPSPEGRPDKDLVTSNQGGDDFGNDSGAGAFAGRPGSALAPGSDETPGGRSVNREGNDRKGEHVDGISPIGSGGGTETPTSVLKSAVGAGGVGLELKDLLLPMIGFLVSLAIAVLVSNRIRRRGSQ